MQRARTALALGVMVSLVAAGCTSGDGGGRSGREGAPSSSTSVPVGVRDDRSRGGSARVGVWGEPDPGAPTLAGAGVRALVLPQLFVAQANGRWVGSLV